MKKILVGVTASIAAYKTADLVRLLKKQGYDIRVVMTASAQEIVCPMTLQVLSQNPVRIDLFNHEDEAKIDHIALARWPDMIVIAPATANFMAKAAHGLADDLLSTLCLATNAPIVIAPAMNVLMWENVATQSNLDTLISRNYRVIEPAEGEQACGEKGIGRMAEPESIVYALNQQLHERCIEHVKKPKNQLLSDKHIVITAGPTVERIDPVRFLSNHSSGKMGYSLAAAAQQMGANVTLVSGKTALPSPSGVDCVMVESAQQMYDAVMDVITTADWFIATAAVADYTIAQPCSHKIKKSSEAGLTLNLVQNPDILASVCQFFHSQDKISQPTQAQSSQAQSSQAQSTQAQSTQAESQELKTKKSQIDYCQSSKLLTIGFAAETENVIENARTKRAKKGCDYIIANDVSDSEIGFDSNDNAVTLIGEGIEQSFAKMPKRELATALLELIAKRS